MNQMHKGSSWLLLAVAVSLGGCGRHAAKVSGDVRLGDRPLSSGVVTFTPAKPGPSAYGNVSPAGRYALQTGAAKGLDPGDYTVTVAANATPEEAAKMGIKVGRAGIMPLLTPPQYADVKTSPLKVTVKPGAQTIDLALDPKPTGKHP